MTKRNNFQIDIFIHEGPWEDAFPALSVLAENAVNETLAHCECAASEISLVFADDAFIQDLNKRYRNMDKPTNVLSFPQDDGINLGDVILAFETIKKEAAEQDKTPQDHLTHLIVHGTLHLLGLDHENDDEAHQMESLEITVLEALGVKNPYATE